jgi:Bacterial SH3 domain
MEEGPKSGADTNIHEFFTNLLVERDQHIKQLQSQVHAAQLAQKAQLGSGQDWEGKYERLHEDHQRIRNEFQVEVNGYKSRINGQNAIIEQLRASKDSVGTATITENITTKTEWALGMFGVLLGIGLGLLLGMWFQKKISTPKNEQTRVFEKLQTKHQFNIEYEIANGRFASADSILQVEISAADNATIKPELEFLRQVMKAAQKKMQQHNVPLSSAGYAVMPDDEIRAATKYRGSITITEPTLAVRSEASTTSEKLATVKKDDVVKIVDRSPRVDKLTTRYEGKRAEVEDIWYKVEIPNGMEGWIFGYYTSASRQSITVFADEAAAGTAVVPGATSGATTKPAAASKDTVRVIVPAKKVGQ